MENAEELQRTLHRFFTAQDATSKSQIEQLLSNTKEQPEAWAQARSLLTHSTDQYVQWLAVSMMDVLLQHRWQTLSNEEQIEVRKFLLEYLHAKYKELPSFVGKKMAKVYLSIGLKDWPQRYPEFLDHIFLLVKSQESRQLGVELLALLAEEFTREDSHLLASRKLELKTHVLEAAPGILELLGQLLQGLFEHNVRVTSISDSQGFQALASPVKRYLRTDFYEGTFDEESIRLARTSLEALMRYFAWIPLNGSLVVPSLLQAIFQYIHLHNATTSVSAFDCINEILEKNYVPKETQEWLTQVFTHVFSLLRSLTAKEGGLEGLDDLFIEKCTRFTSLFVSNHLQRVEADPSFPVNEFLALLFKYTFLQTSLQLFLQCVDVWLSVLDGLREQALLPSSSSGLSSERYRDAIVSLYGEMMKNTLFVTNAAQLQLLDATEKVDDQHTELDLFVEKCMEVVVKCAECYPNPNLQQLCSTFMENSQRICQATEVLSQVERNQEARDYIDNILKDQRSLLIALGGIQTYFLNNFENTFTACNVLLHATLDVGDFLVKHHLYPLGPHVSALLQPSSLPSSPIVSRTSSGAPVGGAEDSPQQVQFRQTITRCVDATCLVIAEANTPPEVRLAAVYCLDSVSSTLRPKGLLGVSRLSWLMENVDRITSTDTKEQTVRVYVAISNALLLPTRGVPVNSSEQHWDERNNKFQEFIASLTRPFVEMAQMEPSHFPAESVGQAELKLSALGGIVAAVKTEGTKTSKDIIYKALEPVIPACLSMVRMYLNQPRILKAVLEFFLIVFDVLKTYLGATFIQETLGTFMELLGGERIQLILQSQDESGITVVCKCVKVFRRKDGYH
ncbi:Exportin-6 [Balamuthia mandrillaris]